MTTSTTDCIRKQITLRAPVSRVWRALTDSTEFGEWFQVRLEGPFALGETIRGQLTYDGCEHMTFEALVERMEPERVFAFRWHPYELEPGADSSTAPTTMVEFRLAEVADGTSLTVTESGFDAIPKERRAEAFRTNESGWDMQMKNIESHVGG